MSSKRKCTPLTVEFKRKVLKAVEENPTKKKVDIAKEFDIPPSTLATIIKHKDRYQEESGLSKVCKRAKASEFQDVEKCVLMWLKQCRDKNVPIGGPVLQEKAQQFAVSLGHANFRASNGWLQNFKKRNEIVFKKVCGESASVDDAVCVEWKEQLSDLVGDYQPEDIYNADETGLFYKCLPDKTLTFKGDPCSGGKHSKERITVLLCVNCTGTNKLKPLVIGKTKKPRCFKNVTSFPTDYVANKKSWMNGDTFGTWLTDIDKQMKKKKILLFIDNCTAHGDIPKLTNIMINFLPPNTTSKLQPLDQGIIQSFKTNYRKEVVRQFLSDMEQNTPTKINVLDAMWMITKAWNNVTKKTISNCFKKSGFKAEEQEEDVTDVPTNWEEVSEALDLQGMEFEEFVSFDDDVAVCGELTEADILDSVSADPDADPEEEEETESDRPDPTVKDARKALEVFISEKICFE